MIYECKNNINGKVYIGKTLQSLEKRAAEHRSSMRQEEYKHYPFYRALNKYGFENFTWREICSPPEDWLDESEIFYIAFYRRLLGEDNVYNISPGGRGGAIRIGYKDSEETREKKRQARKHHKLDCKCCMCRAKRGEKIEIYHRENCQCAFCKVKRGEQHRPDCKCISCQNRRGIKRIHQLGCKCASCKSKCGERVVSRESIEKGKKTKAGRIYYYRHPKEVKEFLREIRLNKKASLKTKIKMRESALKRSPVSEKTKAKHRGTTYNKGRVHIHNLDLKIHKAVKLSELQEYLNNGYKLGRVVFKKLERLLK